jgi:hypothetical protein
MPAVAKETPLGAVIVDYGIYLTNVDETREAPDTITGEISLLTNPRLVRTTSTVPALHKSSFGIRYQLTGVPQGALIGVTDVVVTPGIKNPASDGPVSYRESWQDFVTVGKTIYTGYTFDHAWEAVPGIWKIEIWHKDTQLLSQEFRVVSAKQLRN